MRLSPLSWPIWTHALAVVLVLAALIAILSPLEASYLASGHPVDHATGQLTFDAEKLRGYFAVMEQAGGLVLYRHSQMLDFGLLTLIGLLSALLGTLAARMSQPGGWGRKLGLAAAGLGVAASAFDALENLTSFVFLADPVHISQVWAVFYSGFAAAKFALLGGALATFILALVVGAAARFRAG